MNFSREYRHPASDRHPPDTCSRMPVGVRAAKTLPVGAVFFCWYPRENSNKYRNQIFRVFGNEQNYLPWICASESFGILEIVTKNAIITKYLF